MIEYSDFEGPFLDMIRLCGYSNTVKSIRAFYEKLKFYNEEALFKGFDLLTEDENPPHKLTLSALKSFIRQSKVGEVKKKWNGTPCDECDMGIIFVKRNGSNYIFRCTKCRSYTVEAYPWHTPEDVSHLDCKLENMKKGIDSGNSMFINKQSYIN